MGDSRVQRGPYYNPESVIIKKRINAFGCRQILNVSVKSFTNSKRKSKVNIFEAHITV